MSTDMLRRLTNCRLLLLLLLLPGTGGFVVSSFIHSLLLDWTVKQLVQKPSIALKIIIPWVPPFYSVSWPHCRPASHCRRTVS